MIIAVVLSGHQAGPRRRRTPVPRGRPVGARPVRPRDGWPRARHPGVAGRRRVRRRAAGRRRGRDGVRWSTGWCAASARGKPTLLDPDLFQSKLFRFGITGQMLQQIALGGMMIALPIYLQMVLEYNAMQAGLSLAPLSLTHVRGRAARGKRAGRAAPSQHHPAGLPAPDGRDLACSSRSCLGRLPAGTWWSRWWSPGPDWGSLVSQLNNYTLVADLGGTGQRGRRGELGGRLVRALVRAGVRRRDHAGDPVLRLHQHGGGQHGARPGTAAAGRDGSGGRRGGDEQHRPGRTARRPARRTFRTRSSASTPTPDRSPCRSRC